jgi:hypothetical protein
MTLGTIILCDSNVFMGNGKWVGEPMKEEGHSAQEITYIYVLD